MPRPVTRLAIDGKCPFCGGTDLNVRNYCKPCIRVYERARRATDPDKFRAQERARLSRWRKANPVRRRAQKLRQDYGLTPAQFTDILRAQEDACAICRKPSDDYCVDHCHESKRIRGILCRLCNTGIGQFRDDPALLHRAADYVEEHS